MNRESKPHEEKETGRLAGFRDGVFAIAITLLLLERKVPYIAAAGSSPAALAKALLQPWPSWLRLPLCWMCDFRCRPALFFGSSLATTITKNTRA
jgi:uncharacterized membrane protein